MPTVLFILGWRIFFYSNEGNEPIHVHAEKGNMECKFFLDPSLYEISEAFAYNLFPASKREIRRIIFDHFDHIVNEWNNFFKK
jgi:hypothetical protein